MKSAAVSPPVVLGALYSASLMYEFAFGPTPYLAVDIAAAGCLLLGLVRVVVGRSLAHQFFAGVVCGLGVGSLTVTITSPHRTLGGVFFGLVIALVFCAASSVMLRDGDC